MTGRLEGEVHELRQRVVELSKALDAARGRVSLSMRDQRRCPSCGEGKILHAPALLDRSDAGRTKLAIAQPSVWSSKGLGELEAFFCARCGLAELYVKESASIEPDGKHVRLVEGGEPGEDGPYR